MRDTFTDCCEVTLNNFVTKYSLTHSQVVNTFVEHRNAFDITIDTDDNYYSFHLHMEDPSGTPQLLTFYSNGAEWFCKY